MFNIIFLLIVSFVVYELTIGFIICYYKKPIIAYVNKAKKVFSNPKVILNLSYGLVINGMFGLINFETGWQIMSAGFFFGRKTGYSYPVGTGC